LSERELMKKIQELAFAKAEIQLFLCTHEDNAQALEDYYKLREDLAGATADYERKYGPLTADAVVGSRYSFSDMPWPWQNEKGGGR